MAVTTSSQTSAGRWRAARSWLGGWWQIVHLGAVMGVLALSPASHRQLGRQGLVAHLYLASGPMLPGFTVVTALISLVVIRIVTVTALSYGLTQYALEMVVRVLVLELIPLAAALFAALRTTLPMAAELAALRSRGHFEALLAQGRDPLVDEVLPRVLAGMFSVLLLAAVSGRRSSRALQEISLARARTLELLARECGTEPPDALFTVGLLSLLNVMLEVPMSQALQPLRLSESAHNALLDHSGPWHAMLTLGEALERHDLDVVDAVAGQFGGTERVMALSDSAWRWAMAVHRNA
jgi:hypothetical protein